jgi:hypothetical protein
MDDIPDDEFLLRHIPGGTLWQAPGPRITSANFQLRRDRGETGVSVTLLSLTEPRRLLDLVGAKADSRVAAAQAGEVRALGLRVVPRPLREDPGHAEIQSGEASLDDHACRKRLSLLFHFLPEESIFGQGSAEID